MRACFSFQLPLSGSPVGATPGVSAAKVLSTPSLGITQDTAKTFGFRRNRYQPFNSLSRDHSKPPRQEKPPVWGRLSTPSLGITISAFSVTFWSVSRSFNSLSRDHLPRLSTKKHMGHAFNSLSRDHRARFRDFPALRGVLPRHLFAQMIPKTTI